MTLSKSCRPVHCAQLSSASEADATEERKLLRPYFDKLYIHMYFVSVNARGFERSYAPCG